MSAKDNAKDIIVEAANKNIIAPVDLMVSVRMTGISLNDIVLYMTDRSREYATAMADASIAVNQPVIIPTTIITINIKLGSPSITVLAILLLLSRSTNG